MRSPEPVTNDPKNKVSNLALAAVAGLAGCFTLIVVVGAVFFGLWLDSQFESKPLITVILVIASVPVSIIGMFVIVRAAVSRIKF